MPRHVITEIIAPDYHEFLPAVFDKYDWYYQNVSTVCMLCGKLWAQQLYHYLDPETGKLRTNHYWKVSVAVCPEHNGGGSLLGYRLNDNQPTTPAFLLRELTLAAEFMRYRIETPWP